MSNPLLPDDEQQPVTSPPHAGSTPDAGQAINGSHGPLPTMPSTPLTMPISQMAKPDPTLVKMAHTHALSGEWTYPDLVRRASTSDQIDTENETFARVMGGDTMRGVEASIAAMIEEVRNHPTTKGSMALMHAREMSAIAMAQRLQSMFGNDVLTDFLANDQYRATAMGAVDAANVLRTAILELATVLKDMRGFDLFEGSNEAMSLNGLIKVLRFAGAHLAVAADRETMGDKVLAELRASVETEKQRHRNAEDALRARVADLSARLAAMARVPGDMPQYWFVSDKAGRILCRRGARRDAYTGDDIAWRDDTYQGALKFKTREAAEKFVDDLAYSIATKPFEDAPEGKVHIGEVPLDDIRYAHLGFVEAE